MAGDPLRALLTRLAATIIGSDGTVVYESVIELVADALASRVGLLGLLTDAGDLECVFQESGVPIDPRPGKKWVVAREVWRGSFLGDVIQADAPVLVNSPVAIPGGALRWERVLAAPLAHEGQTVGILLAGNGPSDYVDDHRQRIDAIAGFLGPVLQAGRTRARSENDLRKRDARYRTLFEQAGDYILVLKGSHPGELTIIDANWQACLMHGYSREELLGMSLAQLDQEVQVSPSPDRIEHARAGETIRFQAVHRRKDGSQFPVEVAARIIDWEDGSPIFLSIERDITERKAIEQDREHALLALESSEARFRSIIETAMDAVISIDAQRRVIMWNRAAEILFGHRFEEMRGNDVAMVVPPRFLKAHQAAIDRVLQTGKLENGSKVFELVGLRKDGKEVPIELTVAKWEVRGEIFMTGIIRDLTIRRQEEAEREKLQDQLVLAQKMESVGRLAGGVAHDFNNMLGVIIGHAELGIMHSNSSDPIHADLQEILQAAQRSAELTRKLLAYARKQTAEPRTLDLNETVPGMLKMLQRLIGENILLRWFPGKDLWTVRVDPSQIDQILANLCVNSRDAIKGDGKITIATRNVTFSAASCRESSGSLPGEFVVLSVEDNGTGMAKEALEHLFEPFFTTKEVGQGTGLGLPTIYGIAKQNNGQVKVLSESGKGTTVEVLFPRFLDLARIPIAAAAAATIPVGNLETVLIVEDEAVVLRLARKILEQLGYHVLTASSPGDAIHLCESFTGRIHLLLTDLIMPEMNGHDLAEKLTKAKPGLRCLFMSGYTADVFDQQGIVEEGVAFIQKPFSRSALAAKIREVLDGKGGASA